MTGAELLELCNGRLAGYQNAIEPSTLMSYLNSAKDELWSTLKELDKEYFMQVSQNTDSAQTTYFPNLTPASREYTLPSDCRDIEFIECLTPGYETANFVFVEMNSEEFKQLRRAGGISGQTSTVSPFCFLYTVIGKDQFVLAQYPPATLRLRLWYIKALADFEAGDVIDEILTPFSKSLADFGAQKAMLSLQDATQFTLWVSDWKRQIITLTQGAGDRDSSGALFVEDFIG